jgi:hypothetical protein
MNFTDYVIVHYPKSTFFEKSNNHPTLFFTTMDTSWGGKKNRKISPLAIVKRCFGYWKKGNNYHGHYG